MIKELNGLTIQSTINNFEYYDSEEDDAKSDLKNDLLVATHTINRNERKITDTDTTNKDYPQKLLKNREIPAITRGVMPLVNQRTTNGVATSRRVFNSLHAVLYKDIVTSAPRNTAGVCKDPLVINWKDASGLIPVDKNTVVIPPRTTTQVLTITGPSSPPISIGSQN